MPLPSAIAGKAYVLGDNIDTDQIILAQYLTFNPAIPEEYRMFGKYALSSVPPSQAGLPKGHVPFHADEFTSAYKIVVAGKNFGCGSSREHAPIALDAAGIGAQDIIEQMPRVRKAEPTIGSVDIALNVGEVELDHFGASSAGARHSPAAWVGVFRSSGRAA